MPAEAFKELGSLNDYIVKHELQDGPAAHQEYFTALQGLREARARELGLSPGELHSMAIAYSEVS